MKLHGEITMNNRRYKKGAEVPWYKVYPLFLVHMLMFGWSGFYMAYFVIPPHLLFLYVHGGFAILVYLAFYLAFFGRDEVKWMFINAALGLLGLYSQIGWLLSLFGKKIDDYPDTVHAIPFLYFVLYTFLLRQVFLDITQCREDSVRRKIVDVIFVVVTVAFYLVSFFLRRQ